MISVPEPRTQSTFSPAILLAQDPVDRCDRSHRRSTSENRIFEGTAWRECELWLRTHGMVEPSREAAKRYMQSSRGAKKVQLSTQNDFNRVQFLPQLSLAWQCRRLRNLILRPGKQRLCDLRVEMRISLIFIPKRLKVKLFVLGRQDG